MTKFTDSDTFERCPSEIINPYIMVSRKIIEDCRLSFEGKGMYLGLESGVLQLGDIPKNIMRELIEVGYLIEKNIIDETRQK